MKIAIVGSGISGLSCAYHLAQAGCDVTLFEENDYFGGHTHTVDVSLGGVTSGVDTGFLVFNHRTYPNLVQLFDALQVETVATDMSFSVKLPLGQRYLEWAGANLDTVFTQRRNLCSWRFLRMLRDILRFNQHASALATTNNGELASTSLGCFLTSFGYSREFRDWYLLPMAGCIWSCSTEQMMAFPISTFVQFCHNHGLLQVNDRPQWHTVKGGARQYVNKMLAAIPNKKLNTPVRAVIRLTHRENSQIRIDTANETLFYDHVVLANHSDQALRILRAPTVDERDILGAIRYQPNRAVLHTDSTLLPNNKKAWSAWNYQSKNTQEPQVCVHYLINKLQPLPFKQSVIVSLNPIEEPDATKIINQFEYLHPIFDLAAIAAQKKLGMLQGQHNTWFAGAWTGYGFHEDGLKSGLAVAKAIQQRMNNQMSLSAAA